MPLFHNIPKCKPVTFFFKFSIFKINYFILLYDYDYYHYKILFTLDFINLFSSKGKRIIYNIIRNIILEPLQTRGDLRRLKKEYLFPVIANNYRLQLQSKLASSSRVNLATLVKTCALSEQFS